MDELRDILREYGQSYCLAALDGGGSEALAAQLRSIDFARMRRLYEGSAPHADGEISPAPSSEPAPAARGLGLSIIAHGGAAVVTMAGGQGTRLGFSGPKGCFDIGIGRSLFELQAEKLRALTAETGGRLPWYIMTSPENDGATRAFFAEHGFFGLRKEDVCFFTQGLVPMTDTSGRVLMLAPDKVALGPDGNGGVFAALEKSGCVADMGRRSTEYVFFCGIDNALAKVADPVFFGFAAGSGAPCASKSVLKASPNEKVGVFCLRGGRPGVIEYSELSDDRRSAVGADGSLLYGDANIVAHIIKYNELRGLCGRGMPMHRAFKATAYLDEQLKPVSADKPNSYKYEAFIFDAFAALSRMAIMRVQRQSEFAPVKNAQGQDSPATALALLRAL